MEFMDAFLSIGRTNGGLPESPTTEAEALAMMDRYAVAEALVYHTAARDADPELGNAALAGLSSPRLHRVWAFDPTAVIAEKPGAFLDRALSAGVKAVLVNPLVRGVRVERSPRVLELAEAMAERRIPLLAVYRQWDGGQDLIDWYGLADFCGRFPELPVIAWEWRARSNRPMFDAMCIAPNLRVSLSAIWQAQMVETICESFGAERLVFSLGLPSLDPRSFGAVVAYAGVDQKAKRMIAAENFRSLLRNAKYD